MPSHGTPTYVDGRVGVVGLGLMGGSFARALHAGGREVYAWNRTRSTLELAMVDVVDGELTDESIGSCELIILAGYPQASIDWLLQMEGLISPGAIAIDCVGVKRRVCESCFAIAARHDWHFVGCHPMAGTQHSGYAHSRAGMFRGAPMVMVPPRDMDDIERLDLLDRIERLLAPCGFGQFSVTTAERHDEVIAFTSQLAHVVSNAYVKSPTARAHRGFSAGSYKDLTRVARLNARMWSELFLEDADMLSREIQTLIDCLLEYKGAIDAHDAGRLEALLAEGDRRKREIEGR
ncbi:prephenate dehydrogenase [Olsenella urininfantis]|uniref:prephenate dehydrogenase n=1 Tax=Olsenella urininfantis TaxID=1871033 RepID=UPI0009877B27|nr:prephenate dehydrogenase/arogenate dehydrogenase family protein [Olsenella urininfantis]